jgi:hypothetical protein
MNKGKRKTGVPNWNKILAITVLSYECYSTIAARRKP